MKTSGPFGIVPATAVFDERMTSALLHVLVALTMYADENRICFPSQKTLGERMHISRQAVGKSIDKLEELGYLEKVHCFRENGGKASNKYRLLFDQAPLPMQPHVASPTQADGASPMQREVASHDNPRLHTHATNWVASLTDQKEQTILTEGVVIDQHDSVRESSVGSAVADADAPPAPLAPKKSRPVFEDTSDQMRLARWMARHILQEKPDARVPTDLQGWAREFDLMLRLDKRTTDQLKAVVIFATQDRFWRRIVFSAGKLREKLDNLETDMQEKANATTTKAAAGTTYANGTGARRGAVHASAPAQPDAHNHGPYAHLFDRK